LQLLFRWAITTGALFATVWILQQFGLAQVQSQSWVAWVVAAAIMGLVNSVLRPIASFLTAPLNCLTFGLIGVLVNGLLFGLVPAFSAAGGQPAFSVTVPGAIIGAMLMGLLSGLTNKLLRRPNEAE